MICLKSYSVVRRVQLIHVMKIELMNRALYKLEKLVLILSLRVHLSNLVFVLTE